MDEQKPDESSTAQDAERTDKPLGRGLGQISHLFLSHRISDLRAGDPSPGRLPPPTTSQSESRLHSRTVYLHRHPEITKTRFVEALRQVQGALEEGLRVIDAFLPCYPYGEIDVLAVDRANQLIIIDVETACDDALVLRGLGHFDWVAHNRSNVQRMHPLQLINSSAQPRLFLVAPRFSSLVMSVARHLTEPQINWVRYHVLETGGAMGIFFEPTTFDA
jgi:hypothetical protein